MEDNVFHCCTYQPNREIKTTLQYYKLIYNISIQLCYNYKLSIIQTLVYYNTCRYYAHRCNSFNFSFTLTSLFQITMLKGTDKQLINITGSELCSAKTYNAETKSTYKAQYGCLTKSTYTAWYGCLT